MKKLKEKNIHQGKILNDEVIIVGSFLNQQVDTIFVDKMTLKINKNLNNLEIIKVLNIDASNIPSIYAIMMKLKMPFGFVNKSKALNLSCDLVKAKVSSYDHKEKYEITLTKNYISPQDKVLIADDFSKWRSFKRTYFIS